MKTFSQYSNMEFVSNFELLHDVLTFRVSSVFAVYHHYITTTLIHHYLRLPNQNYIGSENLRNVKRDH